MGTTVKLYAESDFGKSGQYVARLTGRDSKFTFQREFIGTKYGKRNESTSAEVDDPGAYMVRHCGRKGNDERYFFVAEFAGELHKIRADKADCMTVCKALDAGRAFDEIVRVSAATDSADGVVYEILSPAAAAKAHVSATFDSAVEQCAAILGVLPDRELKKALKALRARFAPPPATEPEKTNTQTEV